MPDTPPTPMQARPPMPPGSTGPATVRPDNQGMSTRGHAIVGLAVKLLEQAVPLLGVTGPEGQDVVKALGALGKRFGPGNGDLSRQEMKLMQERANPMGTPQNPQAMQQAIRSKLGAMGVGGGGAPGGAPPEQAAPAAMPGAA